MKKTDLFTDDQRREMQKNLEKLIRDFERKCIQKNDMKEAARVAWIKDKVEEIVK